MAAAPRADLAWRPAPLIRRTSATLRLHAGVLDGEDGVPPLFGLVPAATAMTIGARSIWAPERPNGAPSGGNRGGP